MTDLDFYKFTDHEILFNNITQNMKINVFLYNFFTNLMKNPSFKNIYLFGSAIWRIAMKKFDINKNDFDLLFSYGDVELFDEILFEILKKHNIKKKDVIIETFSNDSGHYNCKKSLKITITIDEFKINFDCVFIRKINKFIKKMKDIDFGLILYNLKSKFYEANFNSIYIDYYLNRAKDKIISFDFANIEELYFLDTKFSRLCKFIFIHDYKYLIEESTIHYILLILSRSFYLNTDYDYKPLFCSCIHRCSRINFDKKFESCLNIKTYEFIKICIENYEKITEKPNITNYMLNSIISLALINRDFDYFIYISKKYLSKIDLEFSYIPYLLRTINDFSITKYFIENVLLEELFYEPTNFLCDYSNVLLYQTFIIDVLFSNSFDYYDKLIKYNPIFNIENLLITTIELKHQTILLKMFIKMYLSKCLEIYSNWRHKFMYNNIIITTISGFI